MNLSKKDVRRLLMLHHHLMGEPLKGKSEILDYVRKIGCIQFDPLNIIAMNPHLVLQSRVKGYRKHLLEELLYKDRLLLDGWDKNMAIYPVEDRPYFRRYFDTALERHSWRDKSILDHLPSVREMIMAKGPVTSKDLAMDHKIDWAWAPTSVARAVLDLMFYSGELLVYDRQGSRKIYDFSKHHLSSELLNQGDPNPDLKAYHEWGLLRRIQAVGILWDRRSEALLGIREMKTSERRAAFQALHQKGQIIKFSVEDLDHDFYMTPQTAQLLEMTSKRYHRRVAFIAPLDSLIWDRPMIDALFDFKYKWEVYTPKIERQYGYYVLPIIFGDEFVGRLEPVHDKKRNTLILKNLWFEKNVKNIRKPFNKALQDFQAFLEADTIEIDPESPTLATLSQYVEKNPL